MISLSAILATVLGLGALGKVALLFGIGGPLIAIATPMLEAVGKGAAPILEAVGRGLAKLIDLFADGVEKCFANPTALIVVAAATLGGAAFGSHHEKKKVVKAPKAAVTQPVKAKPKPAVKYVTPWPFG